MTSDTQFSSTDLPALQRQLAEWRQARSGRSRLPHELWIAAAAAARRHGLSPVARALGLSYPKLRRWMSRPAPDSAGAPAPGPFVELPWNTPRESSREPVGWAELRDGSGRVLRLHVGHDPAAWLALADSFWRRGR